MNSAAIAIFALLSAQLLGWLSLKQWSLGGDDNSAGLIWVILTVLMLAALGVTVTLMIQGEVCQ